MTYSFIHKAGKILINSRLIRTTKGTIPNLLNSINLANRQKIFTSKLVLFGRIYILYVYVYSNFNKTELKFRVSVIQNVLSGTCGENKQNDGYIFITRHVQHENIQNCDKLYIFSTAPK